MKKEYSYGAVIFKIVDGTILFLIEHMGVGHTSLPKGHIEDKETIEECVHREIFEETGIKIKLDTSFSKTITYSPYPETIKDVTFYLAEPLNNDTKVDGVEVLSIEWLDFADALKALTYQTDKSVLEAAKDIIYQKHPTLF